MQAHDEQVARQEMIDPARIDEIHDDLERCQNTVRAFLAGESGVSYAAPIAQTIATLRTYNAWRRDPVGDLPDAQIVGDAIDAAAAHLERIQALEARIVELEAKLASVEQDTRERCKAACESEMNAVGSERGLWNTAVESCKASIDALPRGE